jgi:hypothetical protein
MKRSRALAVLFGLFTVGAALRIATLNTRSFWLDETTAVRQATWPLKLMIERMSDNVHPPFFHTLLHYWIVVFGASEVAVRSFALVWGLAAIPLMYWAVTRIYDRRTALFATGIVALAPFFIWYAQEARMYTMLLFFAILSTGAMWRAMRTNRVGWWALYAVSITLGLMTQYFFAFLLAGQGIHYLAVEVIGRERRLREDGEATLRWSRPWRVFADVPTLWGWLASLVIAALPLAWWAPQVLRHRDLYRGVSGAFNYGGLPPIFGPHFNEQVLVPVQWLTGFHARPVTNNLVAMWPLLITAAFVIGGLARRWSPASRYLAVSGFGAVVMISLFGFWQPIVLEARYFTAAGVPLVILAARLVASLRPRAVRAVVAIALVVALVGWADQSFNPDSVVKWDNRTAMGIVADGYRPGDVVLLIPYFVSSIPQYYLPPDIYAVVQKVPSFDKRGRVRNTPAQLGEDLTRQVGYAERVWVIATWQDVPRIALDRAIVGRWLVDNGYRVTSDHKLRQIRVTLYEGTPKPDFFNKKQAPR